MFIFIFTGTVNKSHDNSGDEEQAQTEVVDLEQEETET